MQKRVAAGIAKLGENMAVPRFVRYAGHGLRRPVHPPGRQDRRPGGVRRRHAGDARPRRVRRPSSRKSRCRSRRRARRTSRASAVPADVLEKEKAIYRAQMEGSGKPANVSTRSSRASSGASTRRWSCPTSRRSATRRRPCATSSRRRPRRSARRSRSRASRASRSAKAR